MLNIIIEHFLFGNKVDFLKCLPTFEAYFLKNIS